MTQSRWHTRPDDAKAKARAHEYATSTHRNLRRHYQRIIDNGNGKCWRCNGHIKVSSRWHLGHDDNDRTIYRGPEHPHCNLTAAARAGNRAQKQRRARRAQSRTW